MGTAGMEQILGLGSERSLGADYILFYAAYLHLRLSRGWHGEKSAWLAVIGFAIIMFNLIFVNLVIAGLHSYA